MSANRVLKRILLLVAVASCSHPGAQSPDRPQSAAPTSPSAPPPVVRTFALRSPDASQRLVAHQLDGRSLYFSLALQSPCTRNLEGNASNLSFNHDPEMDEDESGAYPAEDFRYRGPDGCELILRIGMSGYNNARVDWTNCADHGCPFSQELMTQVK